MSINKFKQKKLVGEGSFFKVYKVFLPTEKGVLSPFALKASKRPFRSKNDRAIYLKEVELMKRIPNNNHVVNYAYAWQEQHHFYVVMEYCRCTLAKLVSIYKITEVFLWTVLNQIANGLEHIHRHGVLHMDIKPVNILVGRDHYLKLADFGQAIEINREDQQLDGCEGDSQYMAPELMKNNAIPTEAADVFSLGLLMCEIVMERRLPSEGPEWHDLRKGRARKYILGRVGRSLEKLILRMLDPNPPGRPSAAQIGAICLKNLKRTTSEQKRRDSSV
jgi:membrane-associated tyrosine- and threonine-specific cdc2-inhibitory kinase